MNNNPILTFSPDGGTHVYALSLTGSLVPWLIGALCVLVGGLALALVEVAHVVISLVSGLLTMPIENFARLAIFLILALLTVFVMRFRARASSQQIGA